jgi:subtilase family serine protease
MSALAVAAVTTATITMVPASANPIDPAVALTGIAGAAPALLTGAVDHGAAPSQLEHATLVLGFRNAAALKALVSSAHAPLSAAEFASTYAATPSTVAAVTSWAKAAGLTVTAAGGQLVSVSAPTAVLASALHTRMDVFTAGTQTYRSVARTVSLPLSIASSVVAISGLSSLQSMHLAALKPVASHPAAHPASAGDVGSLPTFTPQTLGEFYDAPSAAKGAGQTLAVIASGDISSITPDLRTFEATFGLPQAPVTITGPGSSDASGADEFDLDTQYSTGEAPDAALHIYDGASLADADILANVASWVGTDKEKSASFSVGGCELLSGLTGFTTSLDTVLEQGAAQGQSLFVSSGDNGSFCSAAGVGENGVPVGVPSVEYPASSPYVIGVGGTTVLNFGNLGLYTNEIAWYAGGGGISVFESAPSYQTSVTGQRLVPDVALDADPTTGYTVIVSGASETIGGTSASAPSWNGFWADALGAKGSLGYAGPRLYAASSTFHDVAVGTNGLYLATPGFDETTGLGTPDVAKLIAAL